MSTAEEYTWMMLGQTGAGKSCLGNFLLGKVDAFKESDIVFQSETQTASTEYVLFGDVQQQKICVIDTPGLGDTNNLGKNSFEALDIAKDSADLITELTKILFMMPKGIDAFLIVIKAGRDNLHGVLKLIDFSAFLGDFWKHSIVVVTQAAKEGLGRSEKDHNKNFRSMLKGASCPPVWDTLSKTVNDRFVLVEARDFREDNAYRKRVVTKLISLTSQIATHNNGPYRDDLNSIGKKAFENAKMELRHSFENLDSPEAKEAIYENASKRVYEVIIKLVCIKMAGGKDVDQLEEMAKVKEEENQKLQVEADRLHRKYEEEQKRAREADEKAEREKEARIRADEARIISEKQKDYERERRLEAEKKSDHTQKYLNTVEKERDTAKGEAGEERNKRVKAEQETANEKKKRVDAEKTVNVTHKSLLQEQTIRKTAERQRDIATTEKGKAEQREQEEREGRKAAEEREQEEREGREAAEGREQEEREGREAAEGREQEEREGREAAEEREREERQGREAAETQAKSERIEKEKQKKSLMNRTFWERLRNVDTT